MNEKQFQIGDRVQSKTSSTGGRIVSLTVGGKSYIVQTFLGPLVMLADDLLPADTPTDEQELSDDFYLPGSN